MNRSNQCLAINHQSLPMDPKWSSSSSFVSVSSGYSEVSQFSAPPLPPCSLPSLPNPLKTQLPCQEPGSSARRRRGYIVLQR